ncbi:hypothetical protein L917_10879 [Phytophthora nicotianae]|uniref:Uncharacterized protein n=2 Tax=Phytophthora nicotianae TaxID=4792 RepID=V9EWX0_PHYNI|nr:hypothetical protein F443_11383 [Phytophthora nicotianae P1569]ETL90404.1 hypothetical protein L917_10879 [Phytophthora nicotianae]
MRGTLLRKSVQVIAAMFLKMNKTFFFAVVFVTWRQTFAAQSHMRMGRAALRSFQGYFSHMPGRLHSGLILTQQSVGMEETRGAEHPYGNTSMHRRFSFSREAVEAIEKGKYHSSVNKSPDKSPRKAFSSPSMTRTNVPPDYWGELRADHLGVQAQAASIAQDEIIPPASVSDDVSFMLEVKSQSDRFSDDDSDGSSYSSVCSKDEYSPTPSSAESVTSSSPLLHRGPPAGFNSPDGEATELSLLDGQDKPREGVERELQSQLSLDMKVRSPLSSNLNCKLPPAGKNTGKSEDDLPDWLLERTTLSPPVSTTKMPPRSPQQIEDEIRFAVDSAAARVQQELGRREQFNSELQSAAMWSPTQATADKQSATSKPFSNGGNDLEGRAHVSDELFGAQDEEETQPIADHVDANEVEHGDLLLLMEVVIGDGRTETIEIHEGDNPDILASAFAQKHALQPGSVPKLRNLIQEQLNALAEAEPEKNLQSELIVEDEWAVDAEFEQFVNANSRSFAFTPSAPETSHANDGVDIVYRPQPEHHTNAPWQIHERENNREFNYNNLVARYGHSQHSGKVDPEGRRSAPSGAAAPYSVQTMEHSRSGERVSASSRAPAFTTTVQGTRSSSSKKKTNLADAPAYERLHALAESKEKWIQRAQKAKELEQVRDEQRLQQVELMAAKSRELVANRTNGNYAHIGERLHDEALSDIARKVQRHERRVVEREQQQDWMCPKCAYVNQYNDSRCQNKMAQKLRAQHGKSSTVSHSGRRGTASSAKSSFGVQPEVLCGQPKPERLFQPTLLTTSSSAMKAVNANKEKSFRMASMRRQRHQSAVAEEFQQTCPFKPKINNVSEEIVREKQETAAAVAALNGETRRTRNPHLELYENSFQVRVQREEREEEYFKQFSFKPDIGVNALWVAPDKSQSDFVERLAVDKYHELERKRAALHDKYAPNRDPHTGKELFKPETGRAPAFARNKQGLPIGDFLHAAHREQQEYHRQLREKDQREIEKKSQQTFVSEASRQALERRKADTCMRIFNALLTMSRQPSTTPEFGESSEPTNCEETQETNTETVIPVRVDLSALPVEISRVVAIVFEYANHAPISRDAFSGYMDRLVREVPGVTYSQIIFVAEHLQTDRGGRHRHQSHHSDPEREAALAAAEQKELTFHPVIDKNSREIATKHGRLSGSKVFEALNQYYDHYLERKEQLRKQQQREFKKSHPFHPTLVTKTHQREPAAAAFYDKILMGNFDNSGNTVSWEAPAFVPPTASNRNACVSAPPSAPLQTALSNARPCVRPIENERSRFYTAASADEDLLEETTRSISRSSSSSQLEDAELTSRVLAALDEKPASTSPTSSYLLTKALSVNDDSSFSTDKECSVRSPEDSALSPSDYEFTDM